MKTKILLMFFLAAMGFSRAQLPEHLYIVGSATPTGWHIDKSLELENVSSGVYRYTGPMFAGTYKFADSQSTEWNQNFYVKDASDDTKIIKNGEDQQWSVSELAQYSITLNLNTLMIDVQKVSDTPVYTHFWMIGDATDAGWAMDNAINQKFTAKSSTEYVWQGNLSAGSFKVFMGAFNDFDGSFYMPLSDGQSFSNPAAQIVNNGTVDYKWKVTEAGTYTVTVNTAGNTVTVSQGTLGVAAIAKNKFSVWPNPAREILNFNADDIKNGQTAEITDMTGRTVLRTAVSEGKVNISHLKAGKYILKTGNHTAAFLIR